MDYDKSYSIDDYLLIKGFTNTLLKYLENEIISKGEIIHILDRGEEFVEYVIQHEDKNIKDMDYHITSTKGDFRINCTYPFIHISAIYDFEIPFISEIKNLEKKEKGEVDLNTAQKAQKVITKYFSDFKFQTY